ncbi:hypothetical protein [Deinococcus marmoris]|uniref:hypothetical protein n=1 Tax=Deinococcus marmoris TaxID=249408 RepID=UPI0004969FE3|nr:hypothetical protein [Deinococcus marmoris]
MNTQRTVIAGSGLLLILAFLMPWIHIDLFFASSSVSGAALPGQLRSLAAMGEGMNQAFGGEPSGVGLAALLFYALYLIPMAGGLLAYRALTGRPARLPLKAGSAVTGVVILLLAWWSAAQLTGLLGSGLGGLAGSGYWLTLLASVGLVAAPLLRGAGRPVLSAAQRAQLQLRGTQALSGAGQWLGARTAQAAAAIQERRIRGVLGRPLTRTLLDRQDQVIAREGTLITHALTEQAQAAGVLDLLLDSASPAKTVAPHP